MARKLSIVALLVVDAGCMTGPTVQSIPSKAQPVVLDGYTLTSAHVTTPGAVYRVTLGVPGAPASV